MAGFADCLDISGTDKIYGFSGEDLDFLPFYVSGCPNIRRLFRPFRAAETAALVKMPNRKAFAQYLRATAFRMCKWLLAKLACRLGGLGDGFFMIPASAESEIGVAGGFGLELDLRAFGALTQSADAANGEGDDLRSGGFDCGSHGLILCSFFHSKRRFA
jgi:hypothetical protein